MSPAFVIQFSLLNSQVTNGCCKFVQKAPICMNKYWIYKLPTCPQRKVTMLCPSLCKQQSFLSTRNPVHFEIKEKAAYCFQLPENVWVKMWKGWYCHGGIEQTQVFSITLPEFLRWAFWVGSSPRLWCYLVFGFHLINLEYQVRKGLTWSWFPHR